MVVRISETLYVKKKKLIGDSLLVINVCTVLCVCASFS